MQHATAVLVKPPSKVRERQMTPGETSDIVEHLADVLGWPKERVVAEALLRLVGAVEDDFEPFTPEV